MNCALAFTLGFGWLVFICGLATYMGVEEDAFEKDMWLEEATEGKFKARASRIVMLVLLFLVPKACITGVSLAHAKTEQFSEVYWCKHTNLFSPFLFHHGTLLG